jgi:hypothetical protein
MNKSWQLLQGVVAEKVSRWPAAAPVTWDPEHRHMGETRFPWSVALWAQEGFWWCHWRVQDPLFSLYPSSEHFMLPLSFYRISLAFVSHWL